MGHSKNGVQVIRDLTRVQTAPAPAVPMSADVVTVPRRGRHGGVNLSNSYLPVTVSQRPEIANRNVAYVSRTGVTFVSSKDTGQRWSLSRHEQRDRAKARALSRSDAPGSPDGRSEANAKRKGKALPRTFRFVRVNEIRQRIKAWIDVIGGIDRVKFFTLTFPQGTPDELTKKARNIWLTQVRANDALVSYLWVAERQGNGTLHYHLLTNHVIPIKAANGWMRETLRNMGDAVPWSYAGQVDKYNGVDILRKIDRPRNIYGVEDYVCKYLTKTDFGPNGSNISQPWHCSRDFGALVTKARVSIMKAAELIAANAIESGVSLSDLVFIEKDYFTYCPFPSRDSAQVRAALFEKNRHGWEKNWINWNRKRLDSLSPVPDAAPLTVAALVASPVPAYGSQSRLWPSQMDWLNSINSN